MFTAYVVVAAVLSACLAFSAGADFVRWNKVLVVMARAGSRKRGSPRSAS